MSDNWIRDRTDPLKGIWQIGVTGSPWTQPAGAPGMTMRRNIPMPAATVLITHWADTLPNIESALQRVIAKAASTKAKFSLPGLSTYRIYKSIALYRLGGGRILLQSTDTTWYKLLPILTEHISSDIGAFTNLSDARVNLLLDGPSVEWVLSKCLALDVSQKRFPIHKVAQTSLHHMPVLLTRISEQSFELKLFTSYAQSCYDLICHAAEEVGLNRL